MGKRDYLGKAPTDIERLWLWIDKRTRWGIDVEDDGLGGCYWYAWTLSVDDDVFNLYAPTLPEALGRLALKVCG